MPSEKMTNKQARLNLERVGKYFATRGVKVGLTESQVLTKGLTILDEDIFVPIGLDWKDECGRKVICLFVFLK
jgi:hypothetical protein